jgi:branched-chain amino acid transport system ATP-binding protein
MPAPDNGPLLDIRGVSRRFGGLQALNDVSLSVGNGEAVGLVGPNGAGKTTLFNCVCGTLRPQTGSITFAGERIDHLPPHKRARLGIRRTFQRVEVFPELTVRDHLIVAERARRGDGRLWKDVINRGSPRPEEMAKADTVLELVGIGDLADTPVAALSLGHCRLVELARALAGEPTLLLADEPSSGLDRHETAQLADVLRLVGRERRMAVLLVEHDLPMVARAVDRVIVLDFGEQIASGTLEEVLAMPDVRRAYLGGAA